MQKILGIDIGGSHITLAQVDAEHHKIITSTYIREHVDSFEKKENILTSWIDAIHKVIKDEDLNNLQIGIAMPGPFDYENGISLMEQGKFIELFQLNIKSELASRLSINARQIHFINDAAAFLEGEVFGGCVQNYQKIFGITLGTGLGTTFYNGIKATDEDLWDSPFKSSIAEDYLATRWYVNRYFELTGEKISGTLDLLDKSKNIQDQVFTEYANSFADFIIQYVHDYSPEVIVVGGNIAKAYTYFEEKLTKKLSDNGINLPIIISSIFEDAAILGAASYAIKSVKS